MITATRCKVGKTFVYGAAVQYAIRSEGVVEYFTFWTDTYMLKSMWLPIQEGLTAGF